MQERINQHKPSIKKEVIEISNLAQQSCFTQNSKFSSNSQNKPFIRKPVSQRQGFVSPTYTKNPPIQNAQSNSPVGQSKSKQSIALDSHSDQNYWERQQIPQSNINLAIKRHISNQQNNKLTDSFLNNSQAIKQAYYGNDMYALTQIGQNYKVQTVDSDKSQRNICYGQNIKIKTKQNIALTQLNTNMKKVTRTEYFTNNSQQVRSVSSRSLKSKQLNFNQLKISANNSTQSYIRSLEQNIRKLQKSSENLNKKCKWMHQQVEMHLQKQNTMTKQNHILTIEIKTKQTHISALIKQLQQVKNQITNIKSNQQKKQLPIRYKSFKDIQTISSLKELPSKHDQYSSSKVQSKNNNQTEDGYFVNTSLSSQKNKRLSFKTYPGVKSPRNRKQDMSKCSSIIGHNESYFHELGDTSILDDKSFLRHHINLERSQMLCKQLQKERDILRDEIQAIRLQRQRTIQQSAEKLRENTLHYEGKIIIMQSEIQAHIIQKGDLEQKNKTLQTDLDKILTVHQQQVQTLSFKLKQLQSQLQEQQQKSSPKSRTHISSPTTSPKATTKDHEFLNPLQYLLQHPDHQLSTDQQHSQHHYQQQNKSLRKYIQQMLQHYKYIKIQNRMLLKLKQDLQKCQKQKKQIKQQRDMFKKKLLDLIKNKPMVKNNNNKKMAQYQDQDQDDDDNSSEQQISAELELSESEIICHPQSDIIANNH